MNEITITNPTGGKLRNDSGGLGHFGAPRSKRISGEIVRYEHDGVDVSGRPGQHIVFPIDGVLQRESKPYAGYSGAVIKHPRIWIRLWYIEFDHDLIGGTFDVGEEFAIMQDVSRRYDNVTPHVHIQVMRCDPTVFVNLNIGG